MLAEEATKAVRHSEEHLAASTKALQMFYEEHSVLVGSTQAFKSYKLEIRADLDAQEKHLEAARDAAHQEFTRALRVWSELKA